MSKLIDLGSVREETKGTNFCKTDVDGNPKTDCEDGIPGGHPYHGRTNAPLSNSFNNPIRSSQFSCLSDI